MFYRTRVWHFNRMGVLYGAVIAPETLLAGLTPVHAEAAWN